MYNDLVALLVKPRRRGRRAKASKSFFFEKKKQKTFLTGPGALGRSRICANFVALSSGTAIMLVVVCGLSGTKHERDGKSVWACDA
jgi:hypothetical protein